MSEKAQRVRSTVLRNRRRRTPELEEPDSESDEDDDDICGDEHRYSLSLSYDPQMIEGHDTSWITELLLVANDPRKKRAPRTFLCGIAEIEHGGFGMCRGTFDEEKYEPKTMIAKSCPYGPMIQHTTGGATALGTFLATYLA
jgi:hypothetical protein